MSLLIAFLLSGVFIFLILSGFALFLKSSYKMASTYNDPLEKLVEKNEKI